MKDKEFWLKPAIGWPWAIEESRNHRTVIRANGASYRMRKRKSVRLNHLPRGSKRRTGVWNGQNVADMVSR